MRPSSPLGEVGEGERETRVQEVEEDEPGNERNDEENGGRRIKVLCYIKHWEEIWKDRSGRVYLDTKESLHC